MFSRLGHQQKNSEFQPKKKLNRYFRKVALNRMEEALLQGQKRPEFKPFIIDER